MGDSSEFANYELYGDPYIRRIANEIEKVKNSKEGNYTQEDFTKFDNLHYLGHEYCSEFFDSLSLPDNSKILELCSGLGTTARFLATKFPTSEITALDYLDSFNQLSSQMNELCGLRNIKSIQGDATALDLAAHGLEGQCDVVLSLQSFYYITDKKNLFSVCYKALKPGGKLYIEDHVVVQDLPLSEQEEEVATKFRFMSRLNQETYANLLKEAGFELNSYTNRNQEWGRYIFQRAQDFLKNKEKLVEEYGEDLWNTRYMSGIHVSCRLYHDLGMSLEEAREAYPLVEQELGSEEFRKYVSEVPPKFGGAYIVATKPLS